VFEFLCYFVIITGIYFGLPIKEYFEYFHIDTTDKIFLNLNEDYLLDEYISTHFMVNLLIENIPILIFVMINNLFLEYEKKYAYIIINPIIANTLFILLHGVFICLFYFRKKIN